MACYYPMLAERKRDGSVKMLKYATEDQIAGVATLGSRNQLIIGCGRCIGCRLAHSKQWALRCMLEARDHTHNEFLTLTYDEEQIPLSSTTGVPTLNPEHLQKFLKDLRRHYEYHYQHQGIRFYACGEYGSQYMRPHFHLIVFNLPVRDKVQFRYEKNSGWIYTSDEIAKIWGRGFITLGKVTFETAAYVARYIMKKQLGKGAELYDQLGIVPEFTRSSNRRGIAYNYYENNKLTIYNSDEIFVTKGDSVLKLKPPKYYDRLYDLEAPERLAEIKEYRRLAAMNAGRSELSQTDLKHRAYLDLKHDNKREQVKKLIRPL